MKTKLLLLIAVIVLLTGGQADALPDKIFTSSGQILPGEEWNLVYIYNDDTIVDMLGGSADWIATYDASTLNVVDGSADIEAFDYSTVHISGGSLGIVRSSASSTLSFSDSASADSIRSANFATTTITGGTTVDISVVDSAVVGLYGGTITDYISAYDSSTINIYGYDLVKTSAGGLYGYGQVNGYLADDTYFSVDLYNTDAYSHINLVPEPCTLVLVGVGALLVRRKK